MIRLIMITKSGIEVREFHAADHAQGHLDGRSDVMGFRAFEVPSKSKERKKK